MSGLLTELEFNQSLMGMLGCPFEIQQFRRVVSDGILSLLDNTLRNTIMRTYMYIKNFNHQIETISHQNPNVMEPLLRTLSKTELMKLVGESIPETIRLLDGFLAKK